MCVPVGIVPTPIGPVAFLGVKAIRRPDLVFGLPRPSLPADNAELIALAAEPIEYMGIVARRAVPAVIRALKVEVLLDDPVAGRPRGAPVIVLEHPAEALSGGFAAAVEDALVMDSDGASRAIAKHAPFFLVAASRLNVRAGHQLGRPQLYRRVLGKIEDLQKAQLRAEDVVGILVPALGFGRAINPMVAG